MGEQDSTDQKMIVAEMNAVSDVAKEAVFLPPDTLSDLPDNDIRQVAEHAANRAGISMDAWIERAIRRCATEELGDVDLPIPAPESDSDTQSGVGGRQPVYRGHDGVEPLQTVDPQQAFDRQLEALEQRFEAQLAKQTEQLQNLIGDQFQETVSAAIAARDNDTVSAEISVTDPDTAEIRVLLHEYFGVLLPSAQRIETVMQQLDVLLDRTVDFRDLNNFLKKLAADSERTTSSLIPLERAISRLAGNNSPGGNPPASSTQFGEPQTPTAPGGSGISRLFRGND